MGWPLVECLTSKLIVIAAGMYCFGLTTIIVMADEVVICPTTNLYAGLASPKKKKTNFSVYFGKSHTKKREPFPPFFYNAFIGKAHPKSQGTPRL